MAGNKEGGRKAAVTTVQRYGSEFYKRIGSTGGHNGRTGGFASQFKGKDGLTGPERASLVGKTGGERSKRKGK